MAINLRIQLRNNYSPVQYFWLYSVIILSCCYFSCLKLSLHCYFSRLVERFRRAAPSSREERGKERSTPFQLPPPSISSSHSTPQTSHTTTHTTHTHSVCITTYEDLWAPFHSMWQLRMGMEMHIHCTQIHLRVASLL